MAMFGSNWLEEEEYDGPMVPSSWREAAEELKNIDKKIGPMSNFIREQEEQDKYPNLHSKWKDNGKNRESK